jgi:hypothetical protein
MQCSGQKRRGREDWGMRVEKIRQEGHCLGSRNPVLGWACVRAVGSAGGRRKGKDMDMEDESVFKVGDGDDRRSPRV